VADIHVIAPLDDLMTSYTNARPGAGLLVVDLDLGTASGLLAPPTLLCAQALVDTSFYVGQRLPRSSRLQLDAAGG
jgi:hypothetical protein